MAPRSRNRGDHLWPDARRSLPSATRVTVVEGIVQVAPEADTEAIQPSQLAAGQQAEIAPDRVTRTQTPDIERAIAWRQRRLVFRADRLDHVAAEFNRYNRTQIWVEGASVRDRRMSGVFDADDPQPLVKFLAADTGLYVENSPGKIVVRARGPSDLSAGP